MTHFARADESDGIAEQLTRFNALTQHAELPRSMANSAALLCCPETHADWVRPGIMLYGASPLPQRSAAELGLQPVMTLSSELIALRNIKAGDEVGYGGTIQSRHATCASASSPAAMPTATRAMRRPARRFWSTASAAALSAGCRWTC